MNERLRSRWARTQTRTAGGLGPRRALALLAAGLLAVGGCGGLRLPGSPHAASTGARAVAACMRSHGLPDYPDPSGGGDRIQVTRSQVTVNGVALKESGAQLQTAQAACQSTEGAGTSGGPPNPALQKAALAYSQCMRSHGEPNFPDPTVSGNSVQIKIMVSGGQQGSGIDPNSPQFQAAQTACQPIVAAGAQAAGGAARGNG